QIVEADVDEEAEALADLLEDRPGDLCGKWVVGVRRGAPPDLKIAPFTGRFHGWIGRSREAERAEELERLGDAHLYDVAEGAAGHGDGEALRAQPGPAAGVARERRHELGELFADGIGGGLLVPALDVGEDALPRLLVAALRP